MLRQHVRHKASDPPTADNNGRRHFRCVILGCDRESVELREASLRDQTTKAARKWNQGHADRHNRQEIGTVLRRDQSLGGRESENDKGKFTR